MQVALSGVGLTETLQQDRLVIDCQLERLLGTNGLGTNGTSTGGKVAEAMSYAVLGSGQRVRPLLSLRLARLLDAYSDAILDAALAVELVHCASLIIDDLPCMDNEKWRRNRPAVHVEFGESTAILAAFALVSLSARMVIPSDAELDAASLRSAVNFQEKLLATLDCCALPAGQDLDLRHNGGRGDAQRRKIIQLKTVPLFELAVSAGTLRVALSPEEEVALHRFSREFGTAFQVMDDYMDGGPVSWADLQAQMLEARCCLDLFSATRKCSSFEAIDGIFEYLNGKASQKDRRHR